MNKIYSTRATGLFGDSQPAADMPTLPAHLLNRHQRGQRHLQRLATGRLPTTILSRKEHGEQQFATLLEAGKHKLVLQP